MKFLVFPESIPDSRTIWLFRERLKETGKDKAVWKELQKQLDSKGLKVKRGSIQDATLYLSKLILADQATSPVVIMLKLAEAKTEPGPRKEMSFILAMSFILGSISITVSYGTLKPRLLRFMIVR